MKRILWIDNDFFEGLTSMAGSLVEMLWLDHGLKAIVFRKVSPNQVYHIRNGECVFTGKFAGSSDDFDIIIEAAGEHQESDNLPELAIIDGDLGDSSFGENSLSGEIAKRFITAGVKVIRYSAEPKLIPPSLRGLGNYSKERDITEGVIKLIEG